MANGRTVSSKDFWRPVSKGALVGAIIGAGFILTVALGFLLPDKNILRYKKSLFLAAAGIPEDLIQNEYAWRIGMLLRRQHREGTPLDSVIALTLPLVELAEQMKENGERRVLIKYLKSIDTPEVVVLMVMNGRWWKIDNNPDDKAMLQSLLAGEGEVPNIDYNFSIWPKELLILSLLFTQFIAFFAYLINERGRLRWHQLPWGKVWPSLGMMILIPGSLPLLVPAVFFSLLSYVKEKARSGRHYDIPRFDAHRDGTGIAEELIESLRAQIDGDVK